MTITTYEADVAIALGNARRETFAKGEYGLTYNLSQMYVAMGAPVPDMPAEPEAKTIEEAIANGGESGTCSVLDIERVASASAPGATSPFSQDALEAVFGTSKPLLDEIEPAIGELYEELGRGESGYFLCYRDGQPSNYVFIGMSFD